MPKRRERCELDQREESVQLVGNTLLMSLGDKCFPWVLWLPFCSAGTFAEKELLLRLQKTL